MRALAPQEAVASLFEKEMAAAAFRSGARFWREPNAKWKASTGGNWNQIRVVP